MAVCTIVDNPNGNAELFGEVQAKLAESGPMPPEGGMVMIAGDADGKWRVISVWESQEKMDEFLQNRLRPAFAEVGVPQEGVSMQSFETSFVMASESVPSH